MEAPLTVPRASPARLFLSTQICNGEIAFANVFRQIGQLAIVIVLPLEFVALSSRSVSLSVSLTPSPYQARRRYRNIKLCFEPNLFDLHFCTCGDRVRFRRYLNCVHGRRPFKRRNGRCAAQPYSSNLKPSRKEGEPIQFGRSRSRRWPRSYSRFSSSWSYWELHSLFPTQPYARYILTMQLS